MVMFPRAKEGCEVVYRYSMCVGNLISQVFAVCTVFLSVKVGGRWAGQHAQISGHVYVQLQGLMPWRNSFCRNDWARNAEETDWFLWCAFV